MATERQPRPEAAAPPEAQAGEPEAEPLNEAQRWWDEQMAEARKYYAGPLKPIHPRPMTREEAKAWLAERDRELRSLPWKPWPLGDTTSDHK